MELKKQDVGVWIKASEEPTENKTYFCVVKVEADNQFHEVASYVTFNDEWLNPSVCGTSGEVIEWLKPIKGYVLTEDELEKFYNDAVDEGEAEANGDGAATFEQFIHSITKITIEL